MAQVFSRHDVLWLKLFLLALLALAAAGVGVVTWSMQPQDVGGAAVLQPVPFSHKHHVADDGIDCRFCHTSVDKGRVAGLPATEVCMTCHSQLFKDAPLLQPVRDSWASGRPMAWARVHDLPDFAYFDHSIHVNKGVACMECHGRVDQMPLTWRNASLEMQWCLDCHRNPGPHLHRPEQVYHMPAQAVLTQSEIDDLLQQYQIADRRRLTDCSTCHR